jgi:hypothetical protein
MPAYCLFDNIRVDDPRKLEEYKMAAAPLRLSAGSFNAVFFEGLPPPPATPRLAGSVRFEEATPRPSGAEEAV